jgi:glycosyltransferase involved in cell wall biosynthesis
MPPRFSLIIPAYNEERLLPRLLDSVDRARTACAGADSVEADPIEIIVADNMSTDRTAQIAAARGCRVVPVAKRVIAAARNGGAQVARGEILCFIDADSRVHPQTFVAIEAALADRRCIAGATGVSLDRWSLGIALTYALFLPLVWLSGLDAGVVFCRREDFDAVRGYDETRAVAEDVAFLWSLRRLGKTRGQKLKRITRAKAIASTRKFDEFGDWHYFGLIGEGLRQLRGRGGTELTDRYWYKPKR